MTILECLSLTGFIFSLILASIAWFISWRQSNLKKWLVTTGIVLQSELTHTTEENFDNKQKLAWTPHVTYQFEVAGKIYIGDCISNKKHFEIVKSLQTPQPESLKSIVKRYPTGGSVQVHFCPENPQEAVLEVDHFTARILFLSSGITFALSILALLMPSANS